MNKRIKELEALATEIEHSHGAFGEYEKYERLNVQKFAELIIRECVGKVKNADMTDLEGLNSDDVLWLVEKQIKQHFGVNE